MAISKDSRTAAGIGKPFDGQWNYVDAWNQAKMAQYNNDYNYWLWQQQAEYNSPSNQVARLKAAGLNPNFNSIDGTGNLGSMPTSSANMTPSVARNRSLSIQSVLSEVNAIVGAMSAGVENLSRLSDMPPLAMIPRYREALYRTARSQMRTQEYKEFRQLVGSLSDAMFAGGKLPDEITLNTPFMFDVPGLESGSMIFKPSESVSLETAQQRLKNMGIDYDIKTLVERVKKYYADELQPLEKSKLEGSAGMASLGRFIEKLNAGESLSWRDWLTFIMAGAASKFL